MARIPPELLAELARMLGGTEMVRTTIPGSIPHNFYAEGYRRAARQLTRGYRAVRPNSREARMYPDEVTAQDYYGAWRPNVVRTGMGDGYWYRRDDYPERQLLHNDFIERVLLPPQEDLDAREARMALAELQRARRARQAAIRLERYNRRRR